MIPFIIIAFLIENFFLILGIVVCFMLVITLVSVISTIFNNDSENQHELVDYYDNDTDRLFYEGSKSNRPGKTRIFRKKRSSRNVPNINILNPFGGTFRRDRSSISRGYHDTGKSLGFKVRKPRRRRSTKIKW